MKATLRTEDYRIPDLEMVSGFDARRERTFVIDITGVPVGTDAFTNNDPSLKVDGKGSPAGPDGTMTVTATTTRDGFTRLQIRDLTDKLIKEWKIKTFSDQAVRLKIPTDYTLEPVS